jgi:hypothetical protein
VGEVRQHDDGRSGFPVRSQFENRRKKNIWPKTAEDLECDMTDNEIRCRLEELEPQLDDLGRQVKRLRQTHRGKLQIQASARKAVKKKEQDSYTNLRQAREAVRELRKDLLSKEGLIRMTKQERYNLNNQLKTPASGKKASGTDKDKTSIKFTKPDWSNPTVEDKAQYMDISRLQEDATKGNRIIVFSGTDYGVRTMSQTVALSQSQIITHMNRYQALSGKLTMRHEEHLLYKCILIPGILFGQTELDLEDEIPVPVSETTNISGHQPSQTELLESLKLPPSHSITAKKLDDISHTRKIAKKRERRLKAEENVGVRDALKALSERDNVMEKAVTMHEIDQAQMTRRDSRKVLRSFEHSKRRQKELRTQRIRNDRALAKVCAEERKFIQDHGRKTQSK